jgi:D-cysteine desulfhydrase
VELDDAFPRLPIGMWPTPVRLLPEVSELLGRRVYAKLEEECGAWCGSKVRKLEYLLPAARAAGTRTLVAYGAGESSWVAACAVHGTRAGFDVIAAVAGQIPAEYGALYRERGVRVLYRPRLGMLPVSLAMARARAGRDARVLPMGGSGDIGDVGSARAGLEIAAAVGDGSLERPRRVFVAAGTGGTAGGIATGLGLGGNPIPVVAVRVTPRPLGTKRLVHRRAVATASRMLPAFPAGNSDVVAPVLGDSRFHGPGYGQPGAAALEAILIARSDGLVLDSTYASKAFAALISAGRSGARGPLLFVHTSCGPPPVEEVPASAARV